MTSSVVSLTVVTVVGTATSVLILGGWVLVTVVAGMATLLVYVEDGLIAGMLVLVGDCSDLCETDRSDSTLFEDSEVTKNSLLTDYTGPSVVD